MCDTHVPTDKRVRAWCFTYKGHDDDVITRFKSLDCERLVIGREIGENGYKHLQGYIRFKQPQRFSWWKTQFPSAHVEPRKGSETEAANYCMKEGDVVADKGVNFDESLPKGMKKDDEAMMVINEIEKGAKYGQIRQRHKLFCFWNRRNVLDYLRDERWLEENPDIDPTC